MKMNFKASAEPRSWDTLAAILLVCAILTAVTRLVVTRWTEELYVVQTLAFLGVIIGLALGYSRFSARISFLFAFVFGVFAVPWQLGLTMSSAYEWTERMDVIAARLINTVNIVLRAKPVNDNILFVFLMSCLFWAVSVYAGYTLIRHGNAWGATLPSGLIMLVIQSYDPFITRRIWFLAVYLFFTMLIVARASFFQKRQLWKQTNTFVAPDIGFDWIRFTLGASLLLVLLSWAVPAVAESLPPAQQAWQYIRRPWIEFQDHMSNAFSSLKSSVGVVADYYGTTLTLGRGSSLTTAPVLLINAPAKGNSDVRYYWRAYSYDSYSDGQWRNTLGAKANMQPSNPNMQLPELKNRLESSFKITPQMSIATLYSPSLPLWISVPVQADIVKDKDGQSVDMVALQAQPAVITGNTYEVRSLVSDAGATDLKAAGTDYPQWVKDYYLALPDTITPRTRQLAKDISKGLTDPYDIAMAVTNYLRQYAYTEVVDAPPSNQEMVDWWLFDYRKGFCQYYATSEVVLLRSIGIPARMSVGYAQGDYIPVSTNQVAPGQNIPQQSVNGAGTYTVRQRDAHAWPEVYFPGYGWIEFEPTAGQAALVRAEITTPSSPSDQINKEPLDTAPEANANILDKVRAAAVLKQNQEDARTRLVWAGLAILLAGAAFGVVLIMRRRGINIQFDVNTVPIRLEKGFYRVGIEPPNFLRRWAQYAALSPLVHAYFEINRALSRLGKPASPYETPAERGKSLTTLLPSVAEPTQTLVSEYHVYTYAQRPGRIQDAREAGREIRRQSFIALFQRLSDLLRAPFTRFRRR